MEFLLVDIDSGEEVDGELGERTGEVFDEAEHGVFVFYVFCCLYEFDCQQAKAHQRSFQRMTRKGTPCMIASIVREAGSICLIIDRVVRFTLRHRERGGRECDRRL